MRICLVIPVFNEGLNIKKTLNRIPQFFSPEDVIIVNDGSTDNCLNDIKSEKFKIIAHRVNLGKGAALKTGFELALKLGYDWIITMDGDGQHDPAYIPEFIRESASDDFDIIIGRRNSYKVMPLSRRFSNFTTSRLLSLITGMNIEDAQCGYRMHRSEFIKKINLKTSGFETETEILLSAAKMKMRIKWIPISTIYSGETSHIRKWRDTVRFIRLVWKYGILNNHNY